MRRYFLYLTVGILAFGIGALISYKSYKTYQYLTFSTQTEEIKSETKKQLSIKTDNNLVLDKFTDLEKILTDKESIDYKGFLISKLYRKRKLQNGNPVDVPFATVKKGNKKIFELDRDLDDYSREIRFGLFPLLGDENNKQLIIESTANRYDRYAVINLSPKFEVLFDTNDYRLMGDLEIKDIDQDGRYELIQDLSTFFYFGINYRKGFAAIPITLKLDKKKRKYFFSNREFESYILKGQMDESSIEDKIKRVNELKAKKTNKSDVIGNQPDLFTPVMNVFLTYMYLGKEKEAWSYFEEAYDLSDKEEVKAEIKSYLKKDNLYNYSRRFTK